MPFLVKYLQDIPQNCSECPCSIHITKDEVYCNARQKHFTVTDKRPEECEMMECNEVIDEIKIEKYEPKSCDECMYHRIDGLFDCCAFNHGMFINE